MLHSAAVTGVPGEWGVHSDIFKPFQTQEGQFLQTWQCLLSMHAKSAKFYLSTDGRWFDALQFPSVTW